MSCSVAVSPVFSPSSSLYCNKASISPSPDALNLNLNHLKSSSSPSSPSPSSPSSPFRIRIQKPQSVSLLSSSSPNSGAGLGPGSLSTVFKRKRPTRLDIPVAAAATNFAAPLTENQAMREVESEGDGYSVYCKRGRREAMEDRFSAAVNLQGDANQAFFGVFDGHGGYKAAEFAAKNLERNILDQVVRRDEEIGDAVKCGYLVTDTEFLKEDLSGGTCCVTALIRKGNLVVSNAGDCRAVMSRGGVAEALTSDHRPSRKDEQDRIENLGGYVDSCHGVWRIQGSLAVSRGIGDRNLKKWVTAEPDTTILPIEREHEFLLLASDGLWDKVSNQEAIDIARPLCIGVEKPEALLACKKLVKLSASRGSLDDISVMLIQLRRYV